MVDILGLQVALVAVALRKQETGSAVFALQQIAGAFHFDLTCQGDVSVDLDAFRPRAIQI